MIRFNKFQSALSPALAPVARPRALRALPSLMVLTTAMIWGVSAQAGGLVNLDGAVRGTTGVTVAAGPAQGAGVGVGVGVGAGIGANTTVQPGGGTANAGVGLDAGVRAGANGNATADEHKASAGAVHSATDGAGKVLGGVRDTAEAAGDAAASSGKRVAQAGKGEVKSGAGAVKAAGGQAKAKVDAKAGAAVQGEAPAR
jgi:hypothetical protein